MKLTKLSIYSNFSPQTNRLQNLCIYFLEVGINNWWWSSSKKKKKVRSINPLLTFTVFICSKKWSWLMLFVIPCVTNGDFYPEAWTGLLTTNHNTMSACLVLSWCWNKLPTFVSKSRQNSSGKNNRKMQEKASEFLEPGPFQGLMRRSCYQKNLKIDIKNDLMPNYPSFSSINSCFWSDLLYFLTSSLYFHDLFVLII